MKLATTSQLKAHLGIPAQDTSKDQKLSLLLEGSSSYLEGRTSRKFELQQHVLKLSGDGSDQLFLPHYPLLTDSDESGAGQYSITVLKIDDVSVLSEIASGNIDVDPATGILYRKTGVWTYGTRNISITFSAGYALPGDEESGDDREGVPADLALAAIRLAARVYERSTAEGVANVSRSSTSFTFKDAIDDEIKQTIEKYTKIRI